MAKAITLKQPWAQLVCMGHKQFETRGWKTDYRGILYIHSSARIDFSALELCHQDKYFKKSLPSFHHLKGGYIIGSVMLEGCFDAMEIHSQMMAAGDIGQREITFGDYRPGRWAWLLSHPVLFANPRFKQGSLSIWEFDNTQLDETPLISPATAYPGDAGIVMGQSY